jgi:D-3-phosphoglycerate dehydrogenase/C-terminal binding protein
MGNYKVVITDFISGPPEVEQAILRGLARVEALDANNEEQLIGRIEDADAIMLYHNLSLSRRTIQRLRNCRLIVRCGVGYDNVDHSFAEECGIPVANVPDYGTEEVADSSIAMTLALTRGVTLLNSRLREGSGAWFYTQVKPLRRLRGEVFGIVGLGRIGTATAHRAKALNMEVVFYDPYKADGYDKAEGICRVETLDELLAKSYVVSMHCPSTRETRHMIDAAAIAKMQRGSFLVNTARGAVVDTSAIPDAIASGQLAGAAIDVLETEPPSDSDPLITAWRDPNHAAHHRVLINPHSAFYCEEGLRDMRTKGAEACRRALLSIPIRNVVNDVSEIAVAMDEPVAMWVGG